MKILLKLIKYIDRFLHKNFDFLEVDKSIKYNTNYEWIYDYLVNEDGLKDKTFIEVGSRDSLDTLDIISKFEFKAAYIFEPSYAGVIRCIKNIKKNRKYSEKIILYPFALGEVNGTTNFYETIFMGKNHTSPNIGSSTIFSEESKNNIRYKVPIFTLDSLNINFKDVYLIIMDCEGSELPILKKSLKALNYSKYICLESDYLDKTKNCIAIKNFLERNNYKLISTDWPKTPIGMLPNQDKVGNSKFSLLFQNIKT